MKEVLFVLLDHYAAHEIPYLEEAIASEPTGLKENPKYVCKVVAPTMEPVRSIGGFRTLPDYDLSSMPADYAALVLIGGFGWTDGAPDGLERVVRDAIQCGIPVGAICNGASWLASTGVLNHVRHTGNGVEQLKMWGGENYTGEALYVNEQAVSDGGIITANGSAALEFAKEMLLAIENDSPESIEMYYQFYKQGLTALFASQTQG